MRVPKRTFLSDVQFSVGNVAIHVRGANDVSVAKADHLSGSNGGYTALRRLGMDEINELGKYLRHSPKSAGVGPAIPPRGGNTASVPFFALAVMAILVAVFVFLMLIPFARGAASAGVSLGMSMATYLVTRTAAFAGILAFLYLGVRGCRSGMNRSNGSVELMGWGVLIIIVVALAVAAFLVLAFFSFGNY